MIFRPLDWTWEAIAGQLYTNALSDVDSFDGTKTARDPGQIARVLSITEAMEHQYMLFDVNHKD